MNAVTTCPNGHENAEGQRFCGTCGAPLVADTAETSLPAQPPLERLALAEAGSSVEEAGTKPRSRRGLTIGALAAFVVLAAGGALFLTVGGGSAPSHVIHEIHGSVTLMDSGDAALGLDPSIAESGGHCHGTGGYSDMDEGASVTVRDGNGHILATSNLGPGAGGVVGSFVGLCTFTFTAEVPDSNFYSVEVSHRGQVNFSLAEMKKNNWRVDLSLGS